MVQITENAGTQVKKLLERDGRDGLYLRLAVRGGGCSGFMYALEFEITPADEDKVIEMEGVRVLLDPKSKILLSDIILDWYDGLDGSGWRWNNPNATGTCGCGESFSI